MNKVSEVKPSVLCTIRTNFFVNLQNDRIYFSYSYIFY